MGSRRLVRLNNGGGDRIPLKNAEGSRTLHRGDRQSFDNRSCPDIHSAMTPSSRTSELRQPKTRRSTSFSSNFCFEMGCCCERRSQDRDKFTSSESPAVSSDCSLIQSVVHLPARHFSMRNAAKSVFEESSVEGSFALPTQISNKMSVAIGPSFNELDEPNMSATPLAPSSKARRFLLEHAGNLGSPTALGDFDRSSQGWPLTTLCLRIFEHHGVLSTLNIELERMAAFLINIEAGYRTDNPYHNRVHAADVTSSMYSLLVHGIVDLFGCPENEEERSRLLLVCVLAAAIHDYEHPGSNNQFQIKMQSEAAKLYKGTSPIENHSVTSALSLADHIGVFSGVPFGLANRIRTDIAHLVLTTDMCNHVDLVSKFSSLLVKGTRQSIFCDVKDKASNDPSECAQAAASNIRNTKRQRASHPRVHSSFKDRDDKMLILSVALKISDIRHCHQSWDEHKAWVTRLEEEFFNQGDAEHEACLTVSPMMNRKLPGVADHRNSIGFFKAIVIPMLTSWVEMFPQCKPLLNQALVNLDHHMAANVG